MRRLSLVLLATWAVGLPASALSAEEARTQFRVIVHESNTLESLPSSQVSKLFLKEKTRWQDGTEVLPVDLDLKSTARHAFNKVVHGRGDRAIASYWQRQIYSGCDVPPPSFSSDEEVVAYVRRQPGAIGYVSTSVRLEGVREVSVLP